MKNFISAGRFSATAALGLLVAWHMCVLLTFGETWMPVSLILYHYELRSVLVLLVVALCFFDSLFGDYDTWADVSQYIKRVVISSLRWTCVPFLITAVVFKSVNDFRSVKIESDWLTMYLALELLNLLLIFVMCVGVASFGAGVNALMSGVRR